MNAIDYLIKEHQSHRARLKDIEKKTDEFPLFRDELIHHINIEESILYPNLLKLKELNITIQIAWEEHNLIMKLLQEMDSPDLSKENWTAKLMTLKKMVLHHIDDEEKNLFTKIRKLASPEFLLEVGKQMEVQERNEPTENIIYPENSGSHQLSK
jgi:hemerythrin superfamily protein